MKSQVQAYNPCVLLTADAYSLVIKKIVFFCRKRQSVSYSEPHRILWSGRTLSDPIGFNVGFIHLGSNWSTN